MGRAPCCEKEGLKRGRWTSEEDEILRKYIEVNGEGSWRSLPKNAGLKRCGKSCRLRWINYLRNDLKRGNISVDEEDLIIKLHSSLGNRWSVIAGQLPGRTDNEIKNYWNSHLSRSIQTFRKPVGEIPSYVMDLAKMGGKGKKKLGNKTSMKKKNNNSRKNVESNKVEEGDGESLSLPIVRGNSPNSILDQNEEVKSMVLDTCVEREECQSFDEGLCHGNGEVVTSDCDVEKRSVLTCPNDEDPKENNMLGLYMGLDGGMVFPDNFMGDGVLKSTLGEKGENGVVVESSKGYSSCSNGENGEWYCNSSSSTMTSSSFDEGWINWDWESIVEGHYGDDILPWLWEDSDCGGGGGGGDRERMVEESDEKKHRALTDWLLS